MRSLILSAILALPALAATDYGNPGGSGDRRTSITMMHTAGLFAYTDTLGLLDGGSGDTNYVPSGTGFQGKSMWWDFRTGKIVDEITVARDANTAHGEWQPSGSNDGVSWTDIGSPITPPSAVNLVFTFTNSTSYRYYRLTGTSGTVSQTWWREITFKIDQGDTTYESSTSYSNPAGTGNRTSTITVTYTDSVLTDASPPPDTTLLVDGAQDNGIWVPTGTSFIGESIVFDFGLTKRTIDEIKVYLESAVDQGTWLISGSNNATSWTTFSTVVSPTTVAQNIIFVFQNFTGYRYYRLTGDSGSVTQTHWREVEFRTLDAGAWATFKPRAVVY